MTAIHKLNKKDYQTLGLSSLGGALEFYDFIIFIFFAEQIKNTVMPDTMSEWLGTVWTLGIFAAGYLMRPVGGIVMAHMGDLIGRKRVFTFSILLMAIATLGIACIPTYARWGIAAPLVLLLFRMMQGLAVGGEVPGAWTFVAEHVPQRYVGFATGVLTSGLSLGILLGSLIAYAINKHFDPVFIQDWGWRIAFIIGGVFGLFAVWLRRLLQETPIFQEMKAKKALAAEVPLKIVLTRYKRSVTISVLLTWALSATVMITTLLTPGYMKAPPYNFPGDVALAANCITSLFLIFSTPIAGALCDKFGSGRLFTCAGLCFAITVYVFYHYAGYSVKSFYILSAFLGFFSGFVGAVAYVMVRAFPATVRFTGISFSYNASYAVFGGLQPLIISIVHKFLPLAHAWYLIGMAFLTSLIGLYLLKVGEKRQVTVGIEEKIKG